MPFLLDTDTCIYALKHHAGVLEHLLSKSREDIVVSVITETELRTGAAKSSSSIKTLRLVENFLRPLAIAEFTSEDAIAYAHVRAKLARPPHRELDALRIPISIARRAPMQRALRFGPRPILPATLPDAPFLPDGTQNFATSSIPTRRGSFVIPVRLLKSIPFCTTTSSVRFRPNSATS